MNHSGSTELFSSYCYGPVDIEAIYRSSSRIILSLTDSAGHSAQATYENCAYWQLERRHAGSHLSLVQQFSARELLMQHCCPALKVLQDLTDNVAHLLERWEKMGYTFYIHTGSFPEGQVLIAAQSHDYQEYA